MATEEWRDILGLEGIYQVSDDGRIRRIVRFRKVAEGLFEPAETRPIAQYREAATGYMQVRLGKCGGRTKRVHRLVCEAFHGPPPTPGMHVAHWDGTRDNNHKDNLRWASPKENADDRRRHRRDALGEDHYLSRLTAEDIREIRRRHEPRYGSLARLGREFGVTRNAISLIVKRKNWKHI